MSKDYRGIIGLIADIRELANSFIVGRMKSMGMEGLVTSHGNILVMLYTNGPCRMADIAKLINRKKNTVTTLINKLVDHDYVQVTPDPNDHRVKIVSLTSKAMEIKDDFFSLSDELIEATFNGMEESEREAVFAGLKKIRENLK